MSVRDKIKQAVFDTFGSHAVNTSSQIKHDKADELSRQQAWCLYLSHFLSMWTSRLYEYAVILFIQHTFPGDLLPSSINGMAETISVLTLSTVVGRWVDTSPTRLRPLLVSILVNRSTVVLCCLLWLFAFATTNITLQRVLFAIILLLGMVEKMSRMSNMLSFEREWIPTVATSSDNSRDSTKTSYHLTYLNTVIRRIDIACKFLAPLAVSSTMTVVRPWHTALLVGAVGFLGCLIEVWSALFVWKSNQKLRQSKHALSFTERDGQAYRSTSAQLSRFLTYAKAILGQQLEGLKRYFGTGLWVPSIGVATMHGSVLAWSGTLITWLLNCGFSYNQIMVGKGVGIVFELGSTFLFSWAITTLSRRDQPSQSGGAYQMLNSKDDHVDAQEEEIDHAIDGSERSTETISNLQPVVTTAKWSIIGLTICLVPTLAALFVLDGTIEKQSNTRSTDAGTSNLLQNHPWPTVLFLAFLSLTFLGRWTYDLSVTQLTQLAIPSGRRSEFGGTEMAFTSIFSLAHWTSSAIWHHQSDFKWLAVGSVGIVTIATAAYVLWARNWYSRVRTGLVVGWVWTSITF